MFSLVSTDDTFPLPGMGITTMKLEFPLKGKLATCWRDEKVLHISVFSWTNR